MISHISVVVNTSRTICGRPVNRGDEFRIPVTHSHATFEVFVPKELDVMLGEHLYLERGIGQPNTALRCIAPSGAVRLLPGRDIHPYLDAAFEHVLGPPIEEI